LSLTGEATLEPDDAPVAIVFGPENGAVSEKLVYEAAREAHMKHFAQLLVIGFAIGAKRAGPRREDRVPSRRSATYVQATPDLVMGDLLKTMRSSQLFSVSGLPDITIQKSSRTVRAIPSATRLSCAVSTPSTRRRSARAIATAMTYRPGFSILLGTGFRSTCRRRSSAHKRVG